MSTQHRITETRLNVRFGMGGPYKLDAAPGRDVKVKAWRFATYKAEQRRWEHAKAAKAAAGESTANEDWHLDKLHDEVMFAEADARKAMYETGNRWTVVVIDGKYVYLCRGMDEDGRSYEPVLHTGPVSGIVTCLGCHGVGRRVYRKDLGLQKCFTCKGDGSHASPLPETVRRVLEAEMYARLRERDKAMKDAADAFDSDETTVESEAVHVD